MHVAYNPEIFRRNPKLGVGLGVILLCIALGGTYAEYGDYKTLSKTPQEMTVEQAVASPDTIPDGARWVTMPAGLKPVCDQALQETSSGSVVSTAILASDGSQQRWFWVRLKGNAACDSAAAPLTGILKKADSGLPAWLKNKGVNIPASAYPLMEISVGEGPGDVAVLLWIFGGIGVLGLVTIIVFVRMKPSARTRPIARAASAAGR